jgi:hypothetical protein
MRRALVLAVLPLVLAACGAASKSSSQAQLSPAAYVKQAAKKTSTATSEHMTLSANAAVQGQKLVVTGDGDFDNVAKQGDLQMHANVGGLDLPIEAIMDKTTIYMKAAIFKAALPPGKTWISIDLQKSAKKAGIDFGRLLGQDPAQQLAQLQAAGNVSDVGSDVIGGVPVEHYRLAIDLSKLPQGAPIEKLAHPKYAPEDVWVGKDDGYVRRVRASYTAQGQTVTTLMSFSDFGKDVTITVPPASDTMDATKQSLGNLGG